MKRSNLNYLTAWMLTAVLVTMSHAAEIRGRSGMVVTAHPAASRIGVEILQAGGNAVDAAVGAALMLSVAEPHASGLGGGGCMLISLEEADSLVYINYYARAPRLVATDFDSEKEERTGLAVLIPGTVAGLHHALVSFGKMDWNTIVERVIVSVRNGVPVDATLNKQMFDGFELLIVHPQTRSIFLPDGFPPEEGEPLVNTRLIQTLELLADAGPDVFYHGSIADSIESAVRKTGGSLRKSDLAAYRPIVEVPLRSTYRGHTLITAPPPQSGITLIEILNILELKELSQMGNYTENLRTFHFMAEAQKRAYADRLHYLGDPEFTDVPVDVLTSKSYARSRYATIDFERAVPSVLKKTPFGDVSDYFAEEELHDDPDGSTTHISIVDKEGNAVALTQTLSRFWGSGVSTCGFLLNNSKTGFSVTNPVNRITSGRQPRSTICPTLVFSDDRLYMVIGSPGAGRILSTMAEFICHIIDFDMDVDEANRAPRFCARKWADTLPVEDRFPELLIEGLLKMGHPIEKLEPVDLFFGGLQAIVRHPTKKVWIGSSDPRRSGSAIGY